jgi:hypothetical protein
MLLNQLISNLRRQVDTDYDSEATEKVFIRNGAYLFDMQVVRDESTGCIVLDIIDPEADKIIAFTGADGTLSSIHVDEMEVEVG